MAKKEEKNKNNKVKNTKDVKKKKTKKEGYFKQIRKEMALVKWPTLKEVFKYSVTTITLCIFIVLFFIVLNLILSFIKGMFV